MEIVDDSDGGFVKMNPWVIRDRQLNQTAKQFQATSTTRQKSHEEIFTDDRNIQQPKYGPGYVKKMRDHYLALSKTEVGDVEDSPAVSNLAPGDSRGQHTFAHFWSMDGASRKSIELAEFVLVEVQKIEDAVQRVKERTTLEEVQDDPLEEEHTVWSLRQRFEPGETKGSRTGNTTQRRSNVQTVPEKQQNITEVVDCNYPFQHQHILNEVGDQFNIVKGLSQPPSTPWPRSYDCMTFDDFIHSPQRSLQMTPVIIPISDSLRDSTDFSSDILYTGIADTTPLRPPDYWMKKPRRILSPVNTEHWRSEESTDDNAFLEMKSILKGFREKRNEMHKDWLLISRDFSSCEILPNDPNPSSNLEEGDVVTISDDSPNSFSADENEVYAVYRGPKRRTKRKRKLLIIGGGVVPRKTSLANGPKFDVRKEVEFSQLSPTAYAYLEESLACSISQWIPGKELTLDEYQKVRDELKRERYKKFSSYPTYCIVESP